MVVKALRAYTWDGAVMIQPRLRHIVILPTSNVWPCMHMQNNYMWVKSDLFFYLRDWLLMIKVGCRHGCLQTNDPVTCVYTHIWTLCEWHTQNKLSLTSVISTWSPATWCAVLGEPASSTSILVLLQYGVRNVLASVLLLCSGRLSCLLTCLLILLTRTCCLITFHRTDLLVSLGILAQLLLSLYRSLKSQS